MKYLAKLLCLLAVLLSGCHGCFNKTGEKSALKIGIIGGPEAELMQKIKEVAKKEYGLDLELVVFNDYMTPNIALNDKSIDANAFQHQPYLDEMVKNRKFNLISAGKLFIYPLAAYSKKLQKNQEIKAGAKIAIPNDPTNEARALILLHAQGLIELNDAKNLSSTLKDIKKNQLNLKIIELEAAQLPRALDDVDIAIINTTFASQSGLSALKDGLFMEGVDSLYVNIIAIRAEDKQADWVEKLVKSAHDDEVVKAAQTIFQGNAIPGFIVDDVDDGLSDD